MAAANDKVCVDVSNDLRVLAELNRIATNLALRGDFPSRLATSSATRFDQTVQKFCPRATVNVQGCELAADGNVEHPLPPVPGVVGPVTLCLKMVMGSGMAERPVATVTAPTGPGVGMKLARWLMQIRKAGERKLREQRRLEIVVVGHHSMVDSGRTIRVPTLDSLILPPTTDLRGLVATLREFRSEATRKRFERMGRPWRTVVLFAGPPGSGKSASIAAVCVELGISTVFAPGTEPTFWGAGGTAILEKCPSGAAILIEDLDRFEKSPGDASNAVVAAFTGGAEATTKLGSCVADVAADVGSSSSRLLNSLDGVRAPAGGAIVFLTSNHPQLLRGALMRRVEIIVHLTWATDDQLERAVRGWVPECDAATAAAFVAEARGALAGVPVAMSAVSSFLARVSGTKDPVASIAPGAPFSGTAFAAFIKEQNSLATTGSAAWFSAHPAAADASEMMFL